MNYPAASCGVSEECDENYPKDVTPECFYRGSSSEPAWISDPSEALWRTRLKHAGMTVLGKEISLTPSRGELDTQRLKRSSDAHSVLGNARLAGKAWA